MAISSPSHWPLYRLLLQQISMLKLKRGFSNITFDVESVRNNSIARDIDKSVLWDGQYQSYLALGELMLRVFEAPKTNDVL